LRGKLKALSLVAKAVLVLVCLVMVIPSVIRLCPSLVGADESYIVLGGSMKPTLCPGDLAFTVKVDPAEVEVGDIIAVRTESKVYMHRVVEKKISDGVLVFKLKGDANEEPDANYVAGSDFIGKTVFSLPMGYLYTRSGYTLIVATPLMVLAAYQAVKIYRLYDTRKRMRRGLKAIILGKGSRRRRRKVSIFDTTSALLLIIVVAGGTYMMAPYFASGSRSFFTDTESSGCVIQAATWKVPSSITCTVSPSNITVGESVTISGAINPARSAEVTIEISNDTWSTMIKVTSNSYGTYEYLWRPGESGSYRIKASWSGDSSYLGASSNVVTVLVTEPSEGG